MGLGVFTTATAQCHELLSATRDWKSTFRTLKLWTTGEALWNITVDPYSVDLILAGCEAYSHFFLKIKTFVGQGEHHCYMNKKVWARVQATCVLCFSQKPGILCQTNQRNSSFRVKNLGKQALILLKMGAILQTFFDIFRWRRRQLIGRLPGDQLGGLPRSPFRSAQESKPVQGAQGKQNLVNATNNSNNNYASRSSRMTQFNAAGSSQD